MKGAVRLLRAGMDCDAQVGGDVEEVEEGFEVGDGYGNDGLLFPRRQVAQKVLFKQINSFPFVYDIADSGPFRYL